MQDWQFLDTSIVFSFNLAGQGDPDRGRHFNTMRLYKKYKGSQARRREMPNMGRDNETWTIWNCVYHQYAHKTTLSIVIINNPSSFPSLH